MPLPNLLHPRMLTPPLRFFFQQQRREVRWSSRMYRAWSHRLCPRRSSPLSGTTARPPPPPHLYPPPLHLLGRERASTRRLYHARLRGDLRCPSRMRILSSHPRNPSTLRTRPLSLCGVACTRPTVLRCEPRRLLGDRTRMDTQASIIGRTRRGASSNGSGQGKRLRMGATPLLPPTRETSSRLTPPPSR
jgi:hypothetical protein